MHPRDPHEPGEFDTVPPPVDARRPDPPRYSRLRGHASGGIGRVWVAMDAELHREVALKEIHDHLADGSEARARFLLEAEVTGQLEHPGIVPIYGLGAYPDGRPYYAMRFIRGVTLHQAIAEFHGADRAGRRDPGERALAMRCLLGHFVGVCRTLAYAHARGVVHRDLKPANIMLGDFGETLVVDWGLALVVQATGEQTAPSSPLHLPSSGTGTATQGGIVGTPAYMPPEQARGDAAGPLSDVFGLGATLYALLTGRPPYANLADAAEAAFVPPRQANPRVPPALEAVCIKAMARQPGLRYLSARALADDVDRWLADEPVAARPEPVAERLRRWAGRHRTAVAVGVALLVAALAATGLVLAAMRAERDETARQRDRAVAAEADARANLDRAEANLKMARQAVDECFAVTKDHPLFEDESAWGLRRDLLRRALPFYRGFRRQSGDDPSLLADHAGLLLRVGYITEVVGTKEEALACYRQAIEAQSRLVAVAPGGGHEAQLAGLRNNAANLLLALGRPQEALDAHREALRLREKLAGPGSPASARAELAETRHNLAILLSDEGKHEMALRQLEQARDAMLGQPRTADNGSRLAGIRSSLGNVLDDLKRPGEALKEYLEARSILLKLAEARPEVSAYAAELAGVRSNLGVLLRGLGKADEAAREYGSAASALEALSRRQPSVARHRALLARTRGNLSVLLRLQGKHEEALRACQQAIALAAGLAAEQPAVPAYRATLVTNRLNAARTLSLWSAASEGAEARTRAEQGLEHLRQALLVPGYDPEAMRATLRDETHLAALRKLPGFAALEGLVGKASP